MIYLISKQRSLFNQNEYLILSPEEALKKLSSLKIVQLDTETEGLDCFSKKLLTIQLGNRDNQFVFDCTTYNITEILKEYLESNRLFVLWNAAFDLRFLYVKNIWPKHIYDGMLVEQLLYLGYEKDSIHFGLKDAAQRWLNINIDKSIRGQINQVGLTPAVIIYAANDVKFLEEIMDMQMKEIRNQHMENAVKIENSFVKVLAYMEYCGVKLDIHKWQEKIKKDSAKLQNAKENLNRWIEQYFIDHNGDSKDYTIEEEFVIETQWVHDVDKISKNYKYINPNKLPINAKGFTKDSGDPDFGVLYCVKTKILFPFITVNRQGDLFSGFNTKPQCTINWNSPKQLVNVFEFFGFNLETFDKKTKEKKKSTDYNTIKSQLKVSPLAQLYLDYKNVSKSCSSFGNNWILAINNVTNRIHPDYHQLGTNTARLSSGGGESGINIQQLPRDAFTRSCFVAENGNKWISCDYDAQESQLLASVSNDPAMLDLYLNGCKDIHSLVAKMAYGDKMRPDIKIEEIKKEYLEYRRDAKGIEFAINYAGDAHTIANNKNIPITEAQHLYDNYMKGFPGVKKYQDYCKRALYRDGYILMNPVTGHRLHIEDWGELKEVIKWMESPMYHAYYSNMLQLEPNNPQLKQISSAKKRLSDLEKWAVNYRIQNRGAMCFKLSGIYLFNWIIEHNYQNVIKLCVGAHDEWNCECPEEISEEFTKILIGCMEKGAKPFCTRLPLSAGVSRDKDGKLPNYWIHE